MPPRPDLASAGNGASQTMRAGEQLALDLFEVGEGWRVWFVSLPIGVYSTSEQPGSVRTSYARPRKPSSHAVSERSRGQRVPNTTGARA